MQEPRFGLPMQISSSRCRPFSTVQANEAAGAAAEDAALPFRQRFNTMSTAQFARKRLIRRGYTQVAVLAPISRNLCRSIAARHARCPLCNTDITLSLASQLDESNNAPRLPSHSEFPSERSAFGRTAQTPATHRQRKGRMANVRRI